MIAKAQLEILSVQANRLVAVRPLPPPEPFIGADRWLLSSLLQKAIRRSDLRHARRAGHQLLRMDPARLWRRLAIIALEDIGVANLELVSDILALVHAGKGTASLLDVLLDRACRAAMDRTADHLGSLIKPPLPARMPAIGGHYSGLDACFLNTAADWESRLYTLAPLCWGEETASAQRRAIFEEVTDYLVAAGMDPVLVAGLSCQVARSRDRLPLLFAFGWTLWREEAREAGIHHHFPRYELIGGDIPDYGFDPLHTRLGRRAIDLWLKSYLERVPFEPAQVAIALWNKESAACGRTLVWELPTKLVPKAMAKDLELRQLPAHQHQALTSWLEGESDILRCVREAVWKGHLNSLADAFGESELAHVG